MKTLLIYPMVCLVVITLLSCQSLEPESAVTQVAQGEAFNASEPKSLPPDNHHTLDTSQPAPLLKIDVENR